MNEYKESTSGRDAARPARIALVATSTLVVRWFLLDHIRKLSQSYAVTLIVNNDAPDLAALLPCRIVSLQLKRDIAPVADLLALVWLWRHFRTERYQLAHTLTPKAGLLGMLAARLAGVPLRLHTFTGQVWATRTGVMRTLLKNADRMIVRLATDVLADSRSQREFLIAQGVVDAPKISVLAQGSICGVDTARFRPDADTRRSIRQDLGIAPSAIVFLCLGRLKRDKGVLDLARAYAALAQEDSHCQLLVVGPDEEGLLPEVEQTCAACRSRLHLIGFSTVPERYVAASDVLCLPSYREGFGTVVIEAAAAGLPAIGSDIYGIRDAIVPGITGLLHPAGDIGALLARMRELANDPSLRAELATKARARALRDFPEARLTAALHSYYRRLLQGHDG